MFIFFRDIQLRKWMDGMDLSSYTSEANFLSGGRMSMTLNTDKMISVGLLGILTHI